MATIKSGKILIIDDDPDFSGWMSAQLVHGGVEAACTGSVEAGLSELDSQPFDLLLLDVQLPDCSGIEAIRMFRRKAPELPIIMVSGVEKAEYIVKAMQEGAADYLPKPPDPEILLDKIRALIAVGQTQKIHRELDYDPKESVLVGSSPFVSNLLLQISQVALSDASIFIHGETGTGKSLIAKVIHEHSLRRDKPFVVINCASIPENLLESELFGHERGAFTGAVKDKMGRFEMAEGGTLFLDEIGEMPMSLQPKLLRVLQGKEFERVGGNKTIHSDVRIVSATNVNLDLAIKEKRFREDLFYRLNVLPLYAASLRDRKDDLHLLMRHFMAIFCRKYKKEFTDVTEESRHLVESYDWPGNIRELENAVERAVVYGEPPLLTITEDLIHSYPTTNESVDVILSDSSLSLVEMSKKRLIEALDSAKGNISEAAKRLGVGRDTIYRRMKRYGIALK